MGIELDELLQIAKTNRGGQTILDELVGYLKECLSCDVMLLLHSMEAPGRIVASTFGEEHEATFMREQVLSMKETGETEYPLTVSNLVCCDCTISCLVLMKRSKQLPKELLDIIAIVVYTGLCQFRYQQALAMDPVTKQLGREAFRALLRDTDECTLCLVAFDDIDGYRKINGYEQGDAEVNRFLSYMKEQNVSCYELGDATFGFLVPDEIHAAYQTISAWCYAYKEKELTFRVICMEWTRTSSLEQAVWFVRQSHEKGIAVYDQSQPISESIFEGL